MYDDLIKRLRNRRICIQQLGTLNDYPLLREAADAIEELQKPKWIPVTERLPEPMKDVVLFMRYGEYKQLSEFAVGYYDDKLSDFSYCDVTHWMPLPEPPKDNEA